MQFQSGFKSLLTLAIPGLVISSLWYAIPPHFHAFPSRTIPSLSCASPELIYAYLFRR